MKGIDLSPLFYSLKSPKDKFFFYQPAAGEKILEILPISGCSEAIWPPLAPNDPILGGPVLKILGGGAKTYLGPPSQIWGGAWPSVPCDVLGYLGHSV